MDEELYNMTKLITRKFQERKKAQIKNGVRLMKQCNKIICEKSILKGYR